MKRKQLFILLVLYALLFSNSGLLCAQDTSQQRRASLPEVEISTQRPPSSIQTATPTQVLDQQQIEHLGATLLSDAVRQIAGITLKDYGGVGGVKTVSVRGLGSQFSGLSLDGVTVNDAQNGQVDLGRYLLGNTAFISCSNGQLEDLLQSARAIAAGSLIHIESLQPHFWLGERTHIKAGFEAGSFGYFSPSFGWQQKLNSKISLSLWGQYLQSQGNYPYTLYYTQNHNDSSSVEHRNNSQVRMGIIDAHIFYTIDSSRRLEGKVHYTQGYHALPGPVIFYSSKASEHTEEQLFFAQAKYLYRPTDSRWELQLLGKYQLSNDLYEDTAASSLSRRIINTYQQQEAYLSAAATFRASRYWRLGAAADGALNTLHSNLARNNEVKRGTLLATLSAQFLHPVVNVSGNLLGTYVGEGEIRYRQLSPYVGAHIRIVEQNRWTLRGRYFFKENYRVPNFNELYYNSVPRTLEPEKAQQHNLGLIVTWNCADTDRLYSIHTRLTIDGYFNQVSNKIVATPTQNMFLWSMMNVGKVDIHGLDTRLQINIDWNRVNKHWNKWKLSIVPYYSYQHAVDKTLEGGKTYGHQIVYTPRHSGGGELYLETPWIEIGFTLLATGERYYKAQNSDNTLLPGYVDQSLSLAHDFHLRFGTLRLHAQVLNLTDTQYEIVKSYPMMGRNWKMSITYEF